MNYNRLNQEVETSKKIEVLNGYIYIDSTDIDLPLKLDKFQRLVEEADSKMRRDELLLEKKNEGVKEYEQGYHKLMSNYFDKVYEGIDAVFGQDAHKKIFRVRSIAMLEHFLFTLPEELDRIGLVLDTESYLNKKREKAVASGKYKPLEVEDNEVKELE